MPNTSPDNLYYPDATTQIAPLETQLGAMQASVQAALTARVGRLVTPVADHTALAALSGTTGDIAVVAEGSGVVFVRQGSTWVQRSKAVFPSTGARDTAYAKASGAYRTAGAEAEVVGTLYTWIPNTSGVAASGWFPVAGLLPDFSVVASAPQALAGNTWTALTTAVSGGSPELNRGFTSWSSGVLTIAQPGRYDLEGQFSVGTLSPDTRIAAQFNKGSSTATTNILVRNLGWGTNSVNVRRRVTLAAGDDIRFWGLSAVAASSDASLMLTSFGVHYVGPA